MYEDFIPLIEFAVKHKYDNILIKLSNYKDISDQIKTHYNLDELPNLKTKKLLIFLDKL